MVIGSFWLFCCYYTTRLYLFFRKAGGIFGNQFTDYLFAAGNKAKAGAASLGDKATDALDKNAFSAPHPENK